MEFGKTMNAAIAKLAGEVVAQGKIIVQFAITL